MASITRRGESYRIKVSLGYDINGKQLESSMTWKPEKPMTEKQLKKELDRQAVLFEERCRSGLYIDSSIKFFDFTEKWLASYAVPHLRKTTVKRYKSLLDRINPAIGHIRLDRIQPHQLLSFYDNLSEAGIRLDIKYKCKEKLDFKALIKKKGFTKIGLASAADISISVLDSVTTGKNISQKSAEIISNILNMKISELFEPVDSDKTLSQKTIQHHHRLISVILGTAVEWQVIIANPCDRVKAPKVTRKEAKYLDEHDTARLVELLEDESAQHKTMIMVLIYTGIRRGELCGLEWKDIDFETSVMHIRRESLYLPEEGIFQDETKSETSVRSMKISQSAIDLLRAYRAYQNEKKLALGDRWVHSDRILIRWDGRPIHPDTVTGWFHKFVLRHNLPPISIHSLRHTNATLMIAGGVKITTVSNRLGHAQTSTTLNIYAHAIRSADEAAADTLQDILNPNQKKEKKNSG